MTNPRFEELKRRLIDGHPQDIEQVRNWESDFKRAMLTQKLGKNPAMALLLRKIKENIADCNELLTTKGELSDLERRVLFAKRDDCWQWFLDIFVKADKDLAKISKEIDAEIEHLSKQE